MSPLRLGCCKNHIFRLLLVGKARMLMAAEAAPVAIVGICGLSTSTQVGFHPSRPVHVVGFVHSVSFRRTMVRLGGAIKSNSPHGLCSLTGIGFGSYRFLGTLSDGTHGCQLLLSASIYLAAWCLQGDFPFTLHKNQGSNPNPKHQPKPPVDGLPDLSHLAP